MTPVRSLVVETPREDSALPSRLALALEPEAFALSRRISMQLLEAFPPQTPVVWRRARLISLLCLDALNGRRSEAGRAMRWRRFLGVLEPFAKETGSPALLKLVAENRDLV